MTVKIYKYTKTWDGASGETLLGDFEGYIELREVLRYRQNSNPVIGKGFLLLESEIPGIEDCKIEFNGKKWKVVDVETFYLDDTFHHHEIIFG